MRRIAALLVVLALSLLAPAGALAARPSANCPNPDPTYRPGWWLVGKQVWWERTVQGFEAGLPSEYLPVYDSGPVFPPHDQLPTGTFSANFDNFADEIGFGSGDGLLYFVWFTQWDGIDKNGDGKVCMKDRPHTPGNPAYFFNGVDNTAH